MVDPSAKKECQSQPKKMRKTRKEKSNVAVEGMVTRLRSKSMAIAINTTHQDQNSPTSTSKKLSRDAKAVPRRCAYLSSSERFKEAEENIAAESGPMIKDAQHSNKSTPELQSEHHTTTDSTPQSVADAALKNLLASLYSPAPVVSTATPSRCPSQHAKMNPSTLRPAMRSGVIVERNDIMLARTVDRGIPTTKGASNIEEVTSKLTTQNQKSDSPPSLPNRDLNPAAASTIASNLIVEQIPLGEANAASNVIEERPEESGNNPSPSFGLTEMANMFLDDTSSQNEVGSFPPHPLVTVQAYRVKEASAPVLRNILEKHGDVAVNCTMKGVESRSFLLEMICEVIRMLQETNFEHLTPVEIDKMLINLDDCRSNNVEVGWLRERLDKIKEAKKLIKNCPTLKEARNKNDQVIEETSRELEYHEAEMLKLEAERLKLAVEMWKHEENISLKKEKLNKAHGEAERIQGEVKRIRQTVSGFTHSLVDGLI